MTSGPKRIATAIQKGGTGKTTTGINLGAAFAEKGSEVLLVDLDPQAGLTEGVGLDEIPDEEPHIGDFLTQSSRASQLDAYDYLVHHRDPFDVVPASNDMDTLSEDLGQQRLWHNRLDNLLGELEEEGGYDWVVVDSPPQLNRVSDSAIIAAKNVVIPLRLQEPSLKGFETMVEKQLRPINDEFSQIGLSVSIAAIVPNYVTNDGERDRILDSLRENFEEELVDEDFEIRKRIDIGRAWRDGQTLFEYKPDSDMNDRYLELAEFVDSRVQPQEKDAEEATGAV
jgi:chromosome partitioning protein